MGKKEYSIRIENAGEGLNADLPGDMKSLGLIQKVTKELGEWQEQNDKRAFFLIVAGEKEGDDDDRNMAVGSGGDDKDLALMMHGAMNANKDLQKALYRACKLQEITDIDNDNDKQFN